MNLTITHSLAFISPVVVPFGLAYSVIKHALDSYTLLNGIFKVPYLNTRFYLEVCHMMAFSTLIAQLITVISLFLSPDSAYRDFGSATTVGLGFIFFSCFVLSQQVQTDHSWPIRVIPDDFPEPAEETFSQEPSYEPPLKMWLNTGGFL